MTYTSAKEDGTSREAGAGHEEQDDKDPHLRKEKCESDPYLSRVSGIYSAVARSVSEYEKAGTLVFSHKGTLVKRREKVNGFVVQNSISLDQRMDSDRSGKQEEKRDNEMLGRICIAMIEKDPL